MTVDDLESGLARLHQSLAASAVGPSGFEVLGMLRREPAHSAMLAWLLDPEACHGLGDSFLRAFWLRVLGECPSHLTPAVVSRTSQRGSGRAEIILTGFDWRLTIEVTTDSPGEEGSAPREPAVSWRVKREALVEGLIPGSGHERLEAALVLLADLLPAA
jgi:PD-(D/E)XK nuclease superfamily